MPSALSPRPGVTRFRMRVALLVALGVFAQESVWNFHDAQTPVTLAEYTTSTALIGLVMGLDNLLGIFIQPAMGYFSDRTRSRWGRRTPYIVVGVPIAAILFVLIPLAPNLPVLIVVIVAFALTANAFKPITESLIADTQVPEHRSKANAIGRMASSLTIIVSALISLLVVDESVELAFVIPAVLMVMCAAIVVLGLREARRPEYRAVLEEDRLEGAAGQRVRDALREIFVDRDRSRLFMIVAIIVVWGSWSAVRSLLTLYGVQHLGLSRGQAGGFTLPAGLAYLVAAYPVAVISDRFGRRRMMRLGLIVFLAGAVFAYAVPSTVGTYVGMIIIAIGFTGFSINAVVMLWNLASTQRLIGLYTGIFAVACAIGSSIMPAALGAMIDASDWSLLMLYIGALVIVGFVLTFGVRREYAPSQLEEMALVDAQRGK